MKRPKPKRVASPPPAEPEPAGALAMRVVADVQEAIRRGATYQVAYLRLTKAIDELKKVDPYRDLEQDLVDLLEQPVEP